MLKKFFENKNQKYYEKITVTKNLKNNCQKIFKKTIEIFLNSKWRSYLGAFN